MSARSKKLIPRSTAFSMIGREPASSSTHGAQEGEPKVMQPSASCDTFRPVRPRLIYSISTPQDSERDSRRVTRQRYGGSNSQDFMHLCTFMQRNQTVCKKIAYPIA